VADTEGFGDQDYLTPRKDGAKRARNGDMLGYALMAGRDSDLGRSGVQTPGGAFVVSGSGWTHRLGRLTGPLMEQRLE
jgi:hypothetical protein